MDTEHSVLGPADAVTPRCIDSRPDLHCLWDSAVPALALAYMVEPGGRADIAVVQLDEVLSLQAEQPGPPKGCSPKHRHMSQLLLSGAPLKGTTPAAGRGRW